MDKPAAPVFSSERVWRSQDWIVLSLVFAVLALVLMWGRWGGTVEDSLAYFNTARYLRGEVPFSELRAPFPYRLAMPALASAWPGGVRDGFAALNWLATVGTAITLARLVQVAGGNVRRMWLAGLLAIVSVPTYWYAPYLLADPGAIFGRTLFALGVVSGQPWLALGGGLFATAAREENILLLAWLLVFGRIGMVRPVIALALAAGWLIVVRWVIFPGMKSYLWVPNIGTVLAALHDHRSLLSLLGAAVVVLPMAALGWKHAPERIRPLKSLLLLMALPPLYAALSVRVEGRAIWSLYPFLIPIAVFMRFPRR